MTSNLDKAIALAGIVTILGVMGRLLWMANNLGSANPERFMRVAVSVVVEVAVPAFVLIAIFYAVLTLFSVAQGA